MKSNNKKVSIRAVMAWIVSLLVVLSSMMLVQNPASAQELTEVPLGETTTEIKPYPSQPGVHTFKTRVDANASPNNVQKFTIDISDKKNIQTLDANNAWHRIWVNDELKAGSNVNRLKSISRDNKTGKVTIELNEPITLNPNDGISIAVRFRSAIHRNSIPATVRAFGQTQHDSPDSSDPADNDLGDPAEDEDSQPGEVSDEEEAVTPEEEPGAAPEPGDGEVPTPDGESESNLKEMDEEKESSSQSDPSAPNYTVNTIGTVAVGDTKIEKGNPSKLTTTFTRQANFERAIFTVEAPNSILAVEKYTVNITQIEQGVKLNYKVVSFDKNKVVVEVYPIKNGKRVASAIVPENSQVTASGSFSANPTVKLFQLDIYGDVPKPKLPEPQVVVDDYPYLPDAVENPPLQQRCGQNVAIVFDVSRSIGRDGLNAVKAAGNVVIDSLAGSAASVGLFNFSTNSPAVPAAEQKKPLSLADSSNVRTLKSKINNLNIGDPPGTNWEGALRSVKNSGTKYDAVFFVTDGMPSINNARTAGDIMGYWTHTRDLADAIIAANELKKDGTHIEAFPVKMPSQVERYPEFLLKEEVYPTTIDALNDRFRNGEYAVSPGQGYWLGQGVDIGKIQILRRNSLDVTRNQPLWTDGRLTPTQMIRQLLGPDQTDHNRWSTNPVNDWGKLAEQLRKNIAAPCVANLTVEKQIVDSNGRVLEKGIGWQFTASTSGDNIVTEYDASGNPKRVTNTQALRTDGEGLVIYGVNSSNDLPVTVQETIPASSNFKLHQQGGKNAKCTSVSDGSTSLVEVPVENDGETGFKLKMSYEQKLGAVRSVHCIVQNVESAPIAPPKLKVTKLEYDPTSQGPKEIDGLKASFAIFGSDDAGNVDYSKNLLTLESGKDPVETKLESGTYWLVETKSPEGYQLLAQPVQLKLDFKDGRWVGEVVDGAGLVFMDSKAGNNEIWINVADIRTGELPKTGGFGVWLWALLGLLVVGAGGIIARRRTA